MTTIEPQATPQPPEGLPVIEPVRHVRLTPAWQDAEAGDWWLLEAPAVPGETAELRMMISERHVVELLVTFGRSVFIEHGTADGVSALWKLMRESLLRDGDEETIQALRTLLVEQASKGGAA